MKIITLTLNPAFDIHCFIQGFQPYHENLARITNRDSGGKGVNISRALTANGIDNLAFVVLGRENQFDFCQSLSRESIQVRTIAVEGRIRENITIHTENANETRISFPGFNASNELLNIVESELTELIDKDTIFTFTGRVPDGISMKAVKDFLTRISAIGAKTVIDSRSFELQDLLEARPWLIKPNQEEISHYFGQQIETVDQAAWAAKDLHLRGIENVMITLGNMGALLACKEGIFSAIPPMIKPVSTIGAGDSSIAGFLAASVQNRNVEEKLILAVAYGSAACLQKGTQPPLEEAINRLVPQIQFRKHN